MSDARSTVGFIGLGAMGGPMARNLLAGGVPLVVHDIRQDAAATHVQQGATWVQHELPQAACAAAVATNKTVISEKAMDFNMVILLSTGTKDIDCRNTLNERTPSALVRTRKAQSKRWA